MKRILSIICVLIMLFGCFSINAFAETIDVKAREQFYITKTGVPIGSPSDQTGTIIETKGIQTTGTIFSMTATNVTNLLTTYQVNGKSFTGGSFDGLAGEGLRIEGTLTHSLGSSIKAGACYYIPANDTFYSVVWDWFTSGVFDSLFQPKLVGQYIVFKNTTTYYGHITNSAGTGSVSGNLTYSVATS